MAYTIISQNNTTTTLSDENGNVITVPARVTLATSTDYTIKKVNNNSVDLESGDGKIIRGVPACVVLAGEGGGGGGSSLPDQTGQSGKFLTTDGTDASWAAISALVNETTGQNSLSILGANRPSSANMVAIGKYAGSNAANHTTLIGYSATSRSDYGTAIGSGASVGLSANYAIQLGAATNSDANTFKVANANGNFEMMNANGNLPADRLASTTGLADGNYRLRLVMASGVPTLSWVAE